MPALGQTGDLTKQYDSLGRQLVGFRPSPGVVYPVGICVKLLSIDQQQYPDQATVGLPSTGSGQQLIMGVVSDAWPGFDGAGGTTAPLANARGTFDVDVVINGPHPAGLIDNSGTGAVAITNEVALVPSRTTAGYMQGIATPVAAFGTVGVAMLPASGLFSSLSAAALTQASCTDTIGGTPATGDTYTITLQLPYNDAYPGTAQSIAITTTGLTSGQAASVTTAAAAVVTQLNANATYAKYWTATSAAGVITHTFNNNVAWRMNWSGNYNGQTIVASAFTGYTNGSAMNGATHSSSAGGTSTITSSGNFASGAGYKGPIPVMVA